MLSTQGFKIMQYQTTPQKCKKLNDVLLVFYTILMAKDGGICFQAVRLQNKFENNVQTSCPLFYKHLY